MQFQTKPVAEYQASLQYGFTYKQKYTAWLKQINFLEANKDPQQMDYFSKFLELFPYNYQIWNKYAQSIASQYSVNDALRVYQAAVQYNPKSLDLWSYYCSFVYHTFLPTQNFQLIDSVYDKAIEEIGVDYNSQLIWDAHISILLGQKNFQKVNELLMKVVNYPIKQVENFRQRYNELVDSLTDEECKKLAESSQIDTDGKEIKQALQENFDVKLRKNLERNIERQQFEDKIKKVEYDETSDQDLDTWKQYITYIKKLNDNTLTRFIYEKALITQSENTLFWYEYFDFIQDKFKNEAESILEETFLRLKQCFKYIDINLLFYWADFTEKSSPEKAKNIYIELEADDIIECSLRHIQVEIRDKNYTNAKNIFKELLKNQQKDQQAYTFILEKFLKFQQKYLLEDLEQLKIEYYEQPLTSQPYSKFLLLSYLKQHSDPEQIVKFLKTFGLKKALEVNQLTECVNLGKNFLRSLLEDDIANIIFYERVLNTMAMNVKLNINVDEIEQTKNEIQESQKTTHTIVNENGTQNQNEDQSNKQAQTNLKAQDSENKNAHADDLLTKRNIQEIAQQSNNEEKIEEINKKTKLIEEDAQASIAQNSEQ